MTEQQHGSIDSSNGVDDAGTESLPSFDFSRMLWLSGHGHALHALLGNATSIWTWLTMATLALLGCAVAATPPQTCPSHSDGEKPRRSKASHRILLPRGHDTGTLCQL